MADRVEADNPQETTDATQAASVFISYASLDGAIAETVCEALEKAGVTCWIAPRDVTPGAFYGDEIVHAIDAAKAIVLILSQSAATSQSRAQGGGTRAFKAACRHIAAHR